MASVVLVLGGYLVAGVLAILLLEIFKRGVRRRIVAASYDTQEATGGSRWVAVAVTVLALWVFWPFAIYAAIFQRPRKPRF